MPAGRICSVLSAPFPQTHAQCVLEEGMTVLFWALLTLQLRNSSKIQEQHKIAVILTFCPLCGQIHCL